MKKSSAKSVVPSDDWQTEDDLRTLCRAKEIQKDPKRMAKCKALAKSKMMSMASVASGDEDDKG